MSDNRSQFYATRKTTESRITHTKNYYRSQVTVNDRLNDAVPISFSLL